MPDQFSPSFEHALEADMKRLAGEIQRQRERHDSRNLSEQDIVKRSLREIAPPPPPPTQQQTQTDQGSSPLPAYTESASAETKLEIEYLLDVAFHKGIDAAAREAHASNPFVLDAFHDALAGKLYPELQRRGIVK